MKRNAKRVANLIHQLDEDGVYYLEVERFKEDVNSDLGSGEVFHSSRAWYPTNVTSTTTNFTSSHTSTATIAFNAKIGLVET